MIRIKKWEIFLFRPKTGKKKKKKKFKEQTGKFHCLKIEQIRRTKNNLE